METKLMMYSEKDQKAAQAIVDAIDAGNVAAMVRPVLADFAVLMEAKLQKNDHKTSWTNLPVEALFRMLTLEIEEFKVAHEFLGPDEAMKELVDVANYCMILHDRLKKLK
jgi:hypothetical protein